MQLKRSKFPCLLLDLLLKTQMKESGQLSRILRRWLPDSKVCNSFRSIRFSIRATLYQLSFRLTVLAAAISNQWVWRTQFPLLPSLPLLPLWLCSSYSGSWWEVWGNPGWWIPARPRTTIRPRLPGRLQGTQRPSQVIENVMTWQIFSLLKLLYKVGGYLDGVQLLTTHSAESKAMLTLLLLRCPERPHHSQVNETILQEVFVWSEHSFVNKN